jgi:hypothetical protein
MENVSFPMTGDNLKHDYLQKRLPEDEKNGGYNTPFDRMVNEMLPEFCPAINSNSDEVASVASSSTEFSSPSKMMKKSEVGFPILNKTREGSLQEKYSIAISAILISFTNL